LNGSPDAENKFDDVCICLITVLQHDCISRLCCSC